MHKIWMVSVLAMMLAACGAQKQDDKPKDINTMTAFYNCGELGVKAVYKGQDQLVLMALGEEYTLPRVVAASGAKYETPEEAEPYIMFWSKGTEAMLNIDDQTAPTCEQIVPTNTDAEFYEARGNEPFWRVTMNKTQIMFKPMDGDEVTWPRQQAQKQNGLYVYPLSLAATNPATLTIEPMPDDKPCQDSMSGQYYADAVRLEINNQILSGCGGVVTSENSVAKTQEDDAHIKLELGQTEWLLEDINDTGIIDNSHLTLSFDEKENRLYGSAGCNRYFGNYTINGHDLKIHPALGATMMACVAEAMMNQERRYMDLLPTMTEAVITRDGFLVLSNEKDEFLRFSAKN
jgi:heat shock protein HslJ/membrane-bound inhibitor of C-type lysozyme